MPTAKSRVWWTVNMEQQQQQQKKIHTQTKTSKQNLICVYTLRGDGKRKTKTE